TSPAARARTYTALEAQSQPRAEAAPPRGAAALELVDDLALVAAGSHIVIEAAAEDAALKDRLFRELDACSPADTVLATATGRLSVAARAAVVRRPERVLGLHFVDHVPGSPSVHPFVEMAVTSLTSPGTVEAAGEFVASLQGTVIRCADSPGFVVGRVGRPYVLEAMRLLEAGHGSAASIDAALESAGYACGPFRLIDHIGLDLDLALSAALHETFAAARFRPPSIQASLVRQGRLGRARGGGFYRYAADGGADPDETVDERWPLSAEEIVERLELAVINEAYRAVEERVASPPDVDLAMRLGAGHPSGPFERAGQLGLRAIVQQLRRLYAETRDRSGDQYEVAQALWQMATL
ncbi:MAG TPA: 3-hydroxyacyl-CoA dehydrogenase family protein, partial [Candidatus Limnocylindrales bacterium]|nr:3-hydroxyacyl-CoA dehydrogenase family protein [Candidatus Limnocylindrales bacterium]